MNMWTCHRAMPFPIIHRMKYAYCTVRILKLQKMYLGNHLSGIYVALLCIALCGCAAATPPPINTQATAALLPSSSVGAAPTAAVPTIASATPVPASWCQDPPAEPPEALPHTAGDQPEDTGESQSSDVPNLDTTMPLTYDQQTNTILVNQSGPLTLPALSSALGQPDLLHEIVPGEWLLNANLRLGKGVSLTIAGPSVRRLKL